MAKRRRLDLLPVSPAGDAGHDTAPAARSRLPLAEVASEAASRAARDEVVREMTAAESEGRVIKRLPTDAIEVRHLRRDRLVLDEEEMNALRDSIAERGQQTPIEVLRLSEGRFGLISGLRRLEAIRQLGQEDILALVRQPRSSEAAYRAMIEENEIRVGLSFFERAQVAVAAVEQGVYPDVRSAVGGLFAHAPAPKRSKIAKFVTICDALGKWLHFPAAIPEKLGLALAQAIEDDGNVGRRIVQSLKKDPPEDATAERRIMERELGRRGAGKSPRESLAPGLDWQVGNGRVVLSGSVIDKSFMDDLRAFVISRAKEKASL